MVPCFVQLQLGSINPGLFPPINYTWLPIASHWICSLLPKRRPPNSMKCSMKATRVELIIVLAVGIFLCGCKDNTAQKSTTVGDASVTTEKQIREALARLAPEDQELAKAQRFCAINVYRRLGSMGTPVKIETSGTPIFVCSEEFAEATRNGGASIKRIASSLSKSSARLAKLSPEERAAAEQQKYCPIYKNRFLGSMGAPVKLKLNGESVYVCCSECVEDAEANPEKTVAQAKKFRAGETEDKLGQDEDPHHHADHHPES